MNTIEERPTQTTLPSMMMSLFGTNVLKSSIRLHEAVTITTGISTFIFGKSLGSYLLWVFNRRSISLVTSGSRSSAWRYAIIPASESSSSNINPKRISKSKIRKVCKSFKSDLQEDLQKIRAVLDLYWKAIPMVISKKKTSYTYFANVRFRRFFSSKCHCANSIDQIVFGVRNKLTIFIYARKKGKILGPKGKGNVPFPLIVKPDHRSSIKTFKKFKSLSLFVTISIWSDYWKSISSWSVHEKLY